MSDEVFFFGILTSDKERLFLKFNRIYCHGLQVFVLEGGDE